MTDEFQMNGGTSGNHGFCYLVKDKDSVKGGTQRGNFLGRDRASSGSSDPGGIGQKFSELGSSE